MALVIKCLLITMLIGCGYCDEIELEVKSGRILKMLREMVNQTAADTLNLPANATSIRENITDTFSCENRTYGYYADVDNDCQIFHVCLPTQSVVGRNITFRWSFICPAETVFNQEVMVCTRTRDSIPCEESPNYYDLNMEIGKIAPEDENKEKPVKEAENIPVKNQRRQPIRKKQNIIVEELMKDAIEQIENIEKIENIEMEEMPEEKALDTGNEMEFEIPEDNEQADTNSRLGTESLRSGRAMWRGSKKFSNL